MNLTLPQLNLWGLVNSCPLKESLSSCPFNEIRELELKQRLTIIEQLSEPEINSLSKYCNECLYCREKGDFKAINKLKQQFEGLTFKENS